MARFYRRRPEPHIPPLATTLAIHLGIHAPVAKPISTVSDHMYACDIDDDHQLTLLANVHDTSRHHRIMLDGVGPSYSNTRSTGYPAPWTCGPRPLPSVRAAGGPFPRLRVRAPRAANRNMATKYTSFFQATTHVVADLASQDINHPHVPWIADPSASVVVESLPFEAKTESESPPSESRFRDQSPDQERPRILPPTLPSAPPDSTGLAVPPCPPMSPWLQVCQVHGLLGYLTHFVFYTTQYFSFSCLFSCSIFFFFHFPH